MSPEQREALRKWRLSGSAAEFQAIRKKMDAAGIVRYAYNVPINDTFTDEEIDAVFEMARALGVQAIVTATTLPVAQRLVPFLAKPRMRAGLHPSGMNQRADGIGSPESYRQAMTLSPNFGITLDLNQFAAWGPDPLAFIAEMRGRIVTHHAHDRKTGTGAFVPFGEGDVPIKEILLQAKRNRNSYVVMIERIYSIEGSDTLTETKRSLEYFRRVLTS
jgi:sugar phosphate isomerase/epimerase